MAASSSQSPPDAVLANAVGKGGKAKESPRMEEKEKRGLYVRSTSQTKDVLRVTNVLMLTPGRLGSVSDVVLLGMT